VSAIKRSARDLLAALVVLDPLLLLDLPLLLQFNLVRGSV